MIDHDRMEDLLNGDELAAYNDAYQKAFAPLAPPASCPIGWQPNALEPVFYGVREYARSDGAPADLVVFFPSLDGAVFSAPILEGCGRYPLILFAHGDCGQQNPNVSEHYKQWHYPQAQLAESGFVVAVPSFGRLGHPQDLDEPAYAILDQTRTWMRDQWEHRDVLMPEPATGIYGHSYGALVAAIYASSHDVAAFAGLSGVWQDWTTSPLAFEALNVPMLFMWGEVDSFVSINDAQWNALPLPKHKIVFKQGQHWDYLPAGTTPCDQSRGPCQFLKAAASDFVIMFFSKYLPPELVPNLPDLIPDSLIPPTLGLNTFEKVFYGSGHLSGVRSLSSSNCEYLVDWETPDTRRVPFVRYLPQALADHLVRNADLIPQYNGPSGPQGSGPVWVFSQSPPPGAEVNAGATVSMLLRRGPIP